MRTLIATIVAAIPLIATASTELIKCRAPDGFTYWTTPACAAGDRMIATATFRNDEKNLTQMIKTAECRLKAMQADQITNSRPMKPGMAYPGTDTSHCE